MHPLTKLKGGQGESKGEEDPWKIEVVGKYLHATWSPENYDTSGGELVSLYGEHESVTNKDKHKDLFDEKPFEFTWYDPFRLIKWTWSGERWESGLIDCTVTLHARGPWDDSYGPSVLV